MALRYRYRVAQGCCVLGPKGGVFKAGTFLPETLFTQKMLDEHVNSKFIVPVPQGAHELPDVLVENAPGVGKVPTIKTGNADGITTQVSGKQPAISPWVVDPKTLKPLVQAKNIDLLNVMILERDPTARPFETVEEAATFLSQDYGKTND